MRSRPQEWMAGKGTFRRLEPQRNGSPERLGYFLRWLILMSIIILCTAIGFLTWLWWQSANESSSWRRLILGSYATQAVTLSAILVRTAASILAGIACSMIAAIALEKQGVPLETIAEMSVSRYSNNPPATVFFWMFGPALKKPLRVAAAILAFTTFASQFTSTLLVTDLKLGPLKTFPQGMSLPHRSDPSLTQSWEQDDWKTRVAASETFAEFSETVDVPEDEDDTGPTIRAFLPLDLQDRREKLQEYTGMARVLDVRVSCKRPIISEVSFCSLGPRTRTLQLCGKIEVPSQPKVTGNKEIPIKTSFRCPLFEVQDKGAITMRNMTNAWQMCYIKDQFNSSVYFTSELVKAPGKMLRGGYLVWDFGSFADQYENQLDAHQSDTSGSSNRIKEKAKIWTITNSTNLGPWTEQWHSTSPFTIDFSGASYPSLNLPLKASFCFEIMSNQAIGYANITASREKASAEPKYTWNPETRRYNVTAVRQQLGAVSQVDKVDRGIMDISGPELKAEIAKIFDLWNKTQMVGTWNKTHLTFDEITEGANNTEMAPYYDPIIMFHRRITGQTRIFCPDCKRGNLKDMLANDQLGTMFYDTIRDTNSPALAIQASYTTMARYVYYDTLPLLQQTNDASLIWYDEVIYPQQNRGYWAVIAVLAVHIALFLVLFRIFLTTQSSFLDNVWHTVAQISESAACVHILHRANLAQDNVINDRIAAAQEIPFVGGVPKREDETKPGYWAGMMRWRGRRGYKTTETLRYVVGKDGQLRPVDALDVDTGASRAPTYYSRISKTDST